jgi:hypothetical protein
MGEKNEGNRNRAQAVQAWNRALIAKAKPPKRHE